MNYVNHFLFELEYFQVGKNTGLLDNSDYVLRKCVYVRVRVKNMVYQLFYLCSRTVVKRRVHTSTQNVEQSLM